MNGVLGFYAKRFRVWELIMKSIKKRVLIYYKALGLLEANIWHWESHFSSPCSSSPRASLISVNSARDACFQSIESPSP